MKQLCTTEVRADTCLRRLRSMQEVNERLNITEKIVITKCAYKRMKEHNV